MGRPSKRTKIYHKSSLDTNSKNTDPIPMDILNEMFQSLNTDPIPTDIMNEIFQRLPAKSIAKFVGTSKYWTTIIRSNYFINSFSLRQSMELQTQQQQHNRLLFAFNEPKDSGLSKIYENWTFFSSSSATDNRKPPVEFISRLVSQVHGRSHTPIYLKGLVNFIFGRTLVISNPSTGKSIILPVVKSKKEILSRFFGFDPMNGEYKVLCIIDSTYGCGYRGKITPSQNQILTVGSNSLWREIDLWIPHRPESNGVCIDGIIYYLAYEGLDLLELIIVRFDVRSEKFLKQLPCLFLQPLGHSINLINYESKLVIAHKTKSHSFDLWIVEDVEKVEGLKISHTVNRRICLCCRCDFKILGITPSGETIYTYYARNDSFYVVYYNHKTNQRRRVQIRAKNPTSYVGKIAFTDYVESLMLL